LSRLTPDEIAVAVPMLSGEMRQGRIGIGWAAVQRASDTAAAAEASLSLGDVDQAFGRVAALSGKGSAGARAAELASLFGRATAEERDFLVRLVHGELRQGAQEGILIEAVARAASVPAASVRRAAMLAGDLAPVAHAVLAEGAAGLDRFRLVLLRPIRPMLAQTADGIGAALADLDEPRLEHKLDGARVQVHRTGGEVRVFTRTGNDVTAAVPDVVDAALALPAQGIVLDGEAIALRPTARRCRSRRR
jgi:DNA ligase-1